MSSIEDSSRGPFALDADFDVRHRHLTGGFAIPKQDEKQVGSSTGGPVIFPGDAAAQAAGSRELVDGEHNWIYAGPRNVGGRAVALAVDTNRNNVMYAGSASGGVFKTVDGGTNWFPLWFDEGGMPVGAIDVIPSTAGTNEVVWVGTGEVSTGGSEIIHGNGIYRSNDGGQTWTNSGVPGAQPNLGLSFDAVAGDPTNTQICWAVGPAGVFRTTNGGLNWTQFANAAGQNFSDVKYSIALAPPHNPIVFLARGAHRTTGNPPLPPMAGSPMLIRIDAPSAADGAINTALGNPANFMRIAPAVGGGTGTPSRIKIAVGSNGPNIAGPRDTVYATVANSALGHYGLYRTQGARAVPASGVPVWTRVAQHPYWPNEGQTDYNLSIAVDRANVNNVATAMLESYVTTTGNRAVAAGGVVWNQASSWRNERPAHHSDHHASLFVQRLTAAGAPPDLWQAHDGGLSRSTNWSTGRGWILSAPPANTDSHIAPIAAGFIDWEKRDRGFHAAQFYDLAQSPCVPSMFGGGMQDNGVFITQGGSTWHNVLGADGGFVAFDPDDPYRFIATWQGGATGIEFPGDLDGKLPQVTEAPQAAFWPRDLVQGFRPNDGALFVSDTAYDPFDSGQVMLARQNRLYKQSAAATGELWAIEEVGTGLEFEVAAVGGVVATMRILDSPIARALKVVPHVATAPGAGAPAQLLIPNHDAATFDLRGADTLSIEVNGAPHILSVLPADFVDRSAATVAEISQALNRPNTPNLWVGPVFPQQPHMIEIATTRRGTAAAPSTIMIAGTGLTFFQRSQGTYNSPVGSPAIIRLPLLSFGRYVDTTTITNPTLRFSINSGATKTLTFTSRRFANLASITVGELVEELRQVLDGEDVVVRAAQLNYGVNVTMTPGATAAGPASLTRQLGANPVVAELPNTPGRHWPRNLAGLASQMTVSDGVNNTVIPISNPTFVNPTQVWDDELVAVLHNAAQANGIQVRVALGTNPTSMGHATEIEYSPLTPGRVWVGGMAGTLFASDDRGTTWRSLTSPVLRSQDRRVEAIAFHPSDENVIYLGLYGERGDPNVFVQGPQFGGSGGDDPGFFLRSDDGGETWVHKGEDIVDTNDTLQSINAIAVDPAEPNVVYAATNVGVFRSKNRGDSWNPFNEGLPNAWIRDMVVETKTRMLRAACWGRGIYERHIGDAEANDVQIFLRANELDRGMGRPAPRGTVPFASQPSFAGYESPDIKVTRTLPNAFRPAGTIIDAVDFDEQVTSEPVVAGNADVLVCIQNRGHKSASGVRVVALWADASNGMPDLPADFWEIVSDDDAFAGPAPAFGNWTLVGQHTIVDPPVPAGFPATGYDRITNEMPRVHRFTTNFPAAVDAMDSIVILAVITCPDDPVPSEGELNVEKALDQVRHLAVRQNAVVHSGDDSAIYLRSRDGSNFSVAAGVQDAAAPLGLAVGPAAPILLGGNAPFNLSQVGAVSRSLTVQDTSTTVTLTLQAGDVANPAAATAAELVNAFEPQLLNTRLPISARVTGGGLELRPTGTSTAAPTGGSLNVAPLFPGPAPVATPTLAQPGPYALPAFPAGGHTLSFTVTWQQLVTFDPADMINPAAATAAEVRKIINAATREAYMPVRAEPPEMKLRVAASTTDTSERESNIAGAHLADLLVSPATIGVAGRPALFNARSALTLDKVIAATPNFLYLRVTNAGNLAGAIRRRLFLVDHTVQPITLTAIPIPAAAAAQPVPAGGNDIIEVTWNPGAIAPGKHYVLAIVDRVARPILDLADNPITAATTFADFGELHTLATSSNGVAYREFEV